MHDVFSGDIADETRKAYSKHRLFTSVVAAKCTGFMQWNDLYLHHLFRPPLANELRRRLRLRASTEPLTFREWGELLLVGARVSRAHAGLADRWFRRHPGEGAVAEPGNRLEVAPAHDAASPGGTAQGEAQTIEAADQEEFQEAHHVVEADRDVADGVEAEETAVFRDNVKVGDQVAILVDRDEEGVPFLIGDVIGIVQGPGPLKIQWFSPAVKKSGVTGKWTADFLPGGVKPSLECRNRDNVIPVQVVWTLKGFTSKHGGKLTKQCATLIEEWIDTWEALEYI